MGQFGQFGLNEFKWGQTHLSQLHISLDPDKLESNLITAMRGFAKFTCMGCDCQRCPKIDLKHWCISYADLLNLRIICINV